MRTGILLVTLITLGGGAGQADLKALQGTWRVVQAEQDGERVPAEDLKDLGLVIKGESISVREMGKVSEKFHFKLDPTRTPRAVDFVYVDGPNKGGVDRGIYQVQGGNLKFCIQRQKDQPRPEAFATKAKSGLFLVILEKE